MNKGIRLRIEPVVVLNQLKKGENCLIIDVRGKSKIVHHPMTIPSAVIIEPENLPNRFTEWDKTKSYYLYCA